MKATLRGVTFDARGLIKGALGGGGPPGTGKDVDVDVKIANVVGGYGQSLRDLEMAGVWRGAAMRAMQANARIGDGVLSAQQDEKGVLKARATDAGALARFLDLYGRMQGGTLNLTMQQNADGGQGSANIADFVLRDEAALRRLAAAGQAPVGKVEQGSGIDPNETRFVRMSARFSRSPGRVDLSEGVVFNSSFGLTTAGYIDFAHDHVDLNGTFVPAYEVNNLLSHIPVVGMLIGGDSHEGIFGVNYRIVGPASGPTLNVNPLSAMTPGILRKVFGAVDGTTPPVAPSDQVGVDARLRALKLAVRPRATDVLLAAERQLHHARPCSASRPIVALSLSTATSLTRSPPPRICRRASPVEATRPARTKAREHAEPGVEFRRRRHRRSAGSRRARLPRRSWRAVSAAASAASRAVQQRGRLVGQRLLGLVDLGAAERLEPGDLAERQQREQRGNGRRRRPRRCARIASSRRATASRRRARRRPPRSCPSWRPKPS